MTPDAIGSLARQIFSVILSSSTAISFLHGNDPVAIATAIGTLANVGWSIYSHYGMVKTPEK